MSRRRLGCQGAALLLLAGMVGLLALVVTLPDVEPLASSLPETTAFLDAWRERHPGQEPAWRPVPYASISPWLKRAVLVAEDIEFFSHDGFATHEIRQAIRDTLEEGRPLRGASTLTQQLAKNLWLSPSRNPLRKVREALLTRRLEDRLEKRRILELYLNVVEFGPGVFGAEAAARHYFGKPASALTADEAAALAASLPHSRWSPASDSPSYARHRERIRRRMDRAAWIEKVI